MSDITETQPNQTQPAPPAQPGGNKKRVKFSSFLFGVLGFLVLIAIGIMSGYFRGFEDRISAQDTQVSLQLQDQFTLGNQAMNDGQYDVAQAHFQFVIDHNPNFPGVKDAYAQLLLRMQISPTPTETATPLATATPDLRGADQVYNKILQLIAAKPQRVDDWTAILAQLDSLRKIDPNYHAAEIDGYYYTTLRQLGVAEIFNQDCKSINLEGGIYDLTLASNFGPLDSYAAALQTYSRYYVSGATFWELDWGQAQYYFGQVMDALPNLMDSSCLTASARWAMATIKVGDKLLASGDSCGASDQYAAAGAVNIPEWATAGPTATFANDKCHPAPPPAPTATPTLAGTPSEVPSETPTP
jgi:tetratricopeptide (TPR) repeat protein